MQATVLVLDSSGDTAHTFDLADAKAKKEAATLLDKLAKEGRALFKVDPATGEGVDKVGEVDRLGEENIAIPRIVGG